MEMVACLIRSGISWCEIGVRRISEYTSYRSLLFLSTILVLIGAGVLTSLAGFGTSLSKNKI